MTNSIQTNSLENHINYAIIQAINFDHLWLQYLTKLQNLTNSLLTNNNAINQQIYYQFVDKILQAAAKLDKGTTRYTSLINNTALLTTKLDLIKTSQNITPANQLAMHMLITETKNDINISLSKIRKDLKILTNLYKYTEFYTTK